MFKKFFRHRQLIYHKLLELYGIESNLSVNCNHHMYVNLNFGTMMITADSTRCKEIGKVLNYKTEWNYWSGCVVTKPDGNKVLLRQMRDTER